MSKTAKKPTKRKSSKKTIKKSPKTILYGNGIGLGGDDCWWIKPQKISLATAGEMLIIQNKYGTSSDQIYLPVNKEKRKFSIETGCFFEISNKEGTNIGKYVTTWTSKNYDSVKNITDTLNYFIKTSLGIALRENNGTNFDTYKVSEFIDTIRAGDVSVKAIFDFYSETVHPSVAIDMVRLLQDLAKC